MSLNARERNSRRTRQRAFVFTASIIYVTNKYIRDRDWNKDSGLYRGQLISWLFFSFELVHDSYEIWTLDRRLARARGFSFNINDSLPSDSITRRNNYTEAEQYFASRDCFSLPPWKSRVSLNRLQVPMIVQKVSTFYVATIEIGENNLARFSI